MQSSLTPDVIAIRNKIQDTAQDDLRGISSFKEAFAEARRRGLKQFSWGKGSYTTELRRDPPPPPPKDAASGIGGGGSTNREVPESLKGRDTSVQAGESNAAKPAAKPAGKGGSTATKAKTPTPTPTPLQPVNPWRVLGLLAGTTAVGAGTIYGVEKYADYKRRAARASASSTSSAPKPSIFRNLGDNAKAYISKVPFKEKVNEYTSKATNLFKRTPAPNAPTAPSVTLPSAPAGSTFN